MRLIGWLLLFLVGLIWLASQLPSDTSPAPGELAANWRRTAQGWERLALPGPASTAAPTFHPVIVGALEILLVLGAMLAFSSAPKQSRRPGGNSAGSG
jgi:hypothetical protein